MRLDLAVSTHVGFRQAASRPPRNRMRLALALLALFAPACSRVWDGDAPDVTLDGAPPLWPSLRVALPEGMPALLVRGADGADWVAWIDPVSPGVPGLTPTLPTTIRAARLEWPPAAESYQGTPAALRRRAFFLVTPGDDGAPGRLTIVSAGGGAGRAIDLPTGHGRLEVSDEGDAYFYQVGATSPALLGRRDGDAPRPIDVPPGEPGLAPNVTFTHDGAWAFVRPSCLGPVTVACFNVAHATGEARDLLLADAGTSDPVLDQDAHAVLLCDALGLRAHRLDDGSVVTLDPSPCASIYVDGPNAAEVRGGSLFYTLASTDELRSVPRDGSGPPVTLLADTTAHRPRALAPATAIWAPAASSLAPSPEAWVGDWRFSQDAYLASFSLDFRLVRWVELDTAESLFSADPATGAALDLARNVATYDELPDGRVIAVANATFDGPQSRVIVIDETARTARWVADRADGYDLLPDSPDAVVVHLVDDSQSGGLLLGRVPLPPR
jgi:hypothetical protein